MQDAIVAALNSEPYPNPKVGAVLVSENGAIKSIGVHKGPGSNHAELKLLIMQKFQVKILSTSRLSLVFILIVHHHVLRRYLKLL